MNDINMNCEDEFNFRAKRTENDYKNSAEEILYYDKFNEKEKMIFNERIDLNSNQDINLFKKDQNSENFLTNSHTNKTEKKSKYPNFQSHLQLTPADDIEIPKIKYYNYIFNIGSPMN